MLNFKKIKKILLMTIYIIAILLFLLLLNNFFKSPDIKSIEFKSLNNIKTVEAIFENNDSEQVQSSEFDYELVGYRAGKIDASVIVKKGNQEFVVAIGNMLEGQYELIEVNQDENTFRNGKNLYKLDNLVGKKYEK
jgi:hypothetical protein